MWNLYLIEPLNKFLLFLYYNLGSNMGLAIIVLTLVLRLILVPLNIPSIKASIKQKKFAPEIEKLKAQYGKDKKGFAQAQMSLMRKHGVNPLSGCLPQILQIVVLLAMYQVFIKVLSKEGVNTHFWLWDLAKPDQYYILPILAGLGQFLASKLMMPALARSEKAVKETDDKKDDLAYNMQKQSLYLMPALTVIIGFKLPSGLVLYWLITTVFSALQQLVMQKFYEREKR